MTSEPMLRKQYLIPRNTAKKVEQLSGRHKVSGAEIVRRAIDAYQPSVGQLGEAELLAFLDEIQTLTTQTIERLDAMHEELVRCLDSIERGEQRAQVRKEVQQWAKRHPELVDQFAQLFFSAGAGERSAGKRDPLTRQRA